MGSTAIIFIAQKEIHRHQPNPLAMQEIGVLDTTTGWRLQRVGRACQRNGPVTRHRLGTWNDSLSTTQPLPRQTT